MCGETHRETKQLLMLREGVLWRESGNVSCVAFDDERQSRRVASLPMKR